MKVGIFTDSHYSSQEITCGKRYNSQSLRKIREALCAFQAEGCKLVICLGDLIDHEGDHEKETQNLIQVSNLFREFTLLSREKEDSADTVPMKILCMMGNHDAFTFTREEFYGILGEEFLPRTIFISVADGQISAPSKTLFFLDTCYFSDGRSYSPGDTDWTDTFLPDAEALRQELETMNDEELRRKTEAADGEAIIFLHQNIDPEVRADHCLSNAETVRRILEESGRVKTVYQGHFHPGHETEVNGIRYVTFPAMCEAEGAWFVIEV